MMQVFVCYLTNQEHSPDDSFIHLFCFSVGAKGVLDLLFTPVEKQIPATGSTQLPVPGML